MVDIDYIMRQFCERPDCDKPSHHSEASRRIFTPPYTSYMGLLSIVKRGLGLSSNASVDDIDWDKVDLSTKKTLATLKKQHYELIHGSA